MTHKTLTAVVAFLLTATVACGGGGPANSPTTAPTVGAAKATQPASEPAEAGDIKPPADAKLAEPEAVKLTLDSWSVDAESGFLHVYGTVVNNAQTPIGGMVLLKYYDENNQLITAEVLGEVGSDSSSFTRPLHPGQTGYFERTRDLKKLSSPNVKKVEAELAYAVDLSGNAPRGEFSATSHTTDSTGTTEFKGTVKNVGGDCDFPYVEVVLLKDGKVVNYNDAIPTVNNDKLAAGAEAEFKGLFVYVKEPLAFDDMAFALTCSYYKD